MNRRKCCKVKRMQGILAASELPSVVERGSQGPGGFSCGKVKVALKSVLNKLESLIYLGSYSLATHLKQP